MQAKLTGFPETPPLNHHLGTSFQRIHAARRQLSFILFSIGDVTYEETSFSYRAVATLAYSMVPLCTLLKFANLNTAIIF